MACQNLFCSLMCPQGGRVLMCDGKGPSKISGTQIACNKRPPNLQRYPHRFQRLCSISKEQQVQNMLKLLQTTKITTGLWSVWICRFRWKNTLDRIAKLLQFYWVPFPGQLKNPQYAAASFLLLGQEVFSLVHSFFCSWVQHFIQRILHAHSSVPWSLQFFHLHRVQHLWM